MKTVFLNWIVLLLSLVDIFCAKLYPQQNINDKYHHYNIILISIDTLRADHLGCYGYFRNTSPNIDKFAKEGILFEQAISQATWTLPSHASIFTSQYVPVHGVYFFNRLPDAEVTLAEILKTYGYKTAAFTGDGHVSSIFGLDQGFDIFDDTKPEKRWARTFKETVPLALSWLKENKNNKFFLFLHGYDVHEPYYSSSENIFDPDYKGKIDNIKLDGLWCKIYKNFILSDDDKIIILDPKDVHHIIAHYDGGIRAMDEKIGEFLREIKKLRILDNTIIIILSDHGEALGERSVMSWHAYIFHDEIIHVPLIIKHPQIKGPIRIKAQAQLIDVMPTIFDFLGIPKNEEAQGNSLLPLIEDKAPKNFNEYVYSEFNVIRTLEWKAITYNELYNLKDDPKELNNLAQQHPEVLLNLNKRFIKWREDCAGLIDKKLNRRMNAEKLIKNEKREKIKNVGYW